MNNAPATIILTIGLLIVSSSHAEVRDTLQTPPCDTVIITGNKITTERAIKAVLDLDAVKMRDTGAVSAARRRLLSTGVFDSVSLVPKSIACGTRLDVIVWERPVIGLSDVALYSEKLKYGSRENGYLTRVCLGVTNWNLGGDMQQIGVQCSFWEGRSLSLSYRKPFLGTPWFVAGNGGVLYLPDYFYPFDRMTVSGNMSFGFDMDTWGSVAILMTPAYDRFFWKCEDALRAVSPEYFNSLTAGVSWTLDTRDKDYNASSGSFTKAEVRTNAIHPGEAQLIYVQFNGEYCFFMPGMARDHVTAMRMRTTLRSRAAAFHSALFAGGIETLRGYPMGWLPGSGFQADNRVLGTIEYRFPIWTTPVLTFLESLGKMFKGFHYRFEGAFFYDGAYVWKDLVDPMSPSGKHAYGNSIGTGLRLFVPTFDINALFDSAWPLEKAMISKRENPYMPEIYIDAGLPF